MNVNESNLTTSESSTASTYPESFLRRYRPTFSPEHGVYVVLLVSFLTGAATTQQWNPETTLALFCTFAAFQAEHPLILQIKQRRSWKPRFLLWGGIYTAIALGIAIYLCWQTPVLSWLVLGATTILAIDAIAVFKRQQKSVMNELLTFTGVCLAAPFTSIATNGIINGSIFGLWLLNAFFFSSAIFTVKLRKPKTESLVPSLVYHVVACLGILGLWYCDWLSAITASAFGVALFKFALILVAQQWYRTTQIQNVAILETISGVLFLAIVSISLLPAHLANMG